MKSLILASITCPLVLTGCAAFREFLSSPEGQEALTQAGTQVIGSSAGGPLGWGIGAAGAAVTLGGAYMVWKKKQEKKQEEKDS